MADIQIIGLKEFKTAIKRNPKVVISEGNKLVTRAKAEALRMIKNRPPWRVGESGKGKGAPKDTGNLRSQHTSRFINKLEVSIYPVADYAPYLHSGTSRMKARPWLDIVKEDIKPYIKNLEKDFMNKVVKNLVK